MYQKKRKIPGWKLTVICCLALLLAGCSHQAGFYVEQQEENAADDAVQDSDGTQDKNDAQKSSTAEDNVDGQGNSGAEDTVDGQGNSEAEDTMTGQGDGVTVSMIYVQVSGAVVHPGVYQLPEGSRIFEAVELAGGVTEEADITSVNQAQFLSDGQMIYMYAVGEEGAKEAIAEAVAGAASEAAGEKTAEAESDDRVNINTATAEQLMTLPGIGQSKAESIISFREEHGAFGSVEEIMNIEGIKEGVFSKIKDRIKVN